MPQQDSPDGFVAVINGLGIAPPIGTDPIGYAELIRQHQLRVPMPARLTAVNPGSTRTEVDDGNIRWRVLSREYRPDDSLRAHLLFALRHEGVELLVLKRLFEAVPRSEIQAVVAAAPTGQHPRRLWFLYEWLTGQRLPMADAAMGNYAEVLDPKLCYTASTPTRSKRHRILNNLTGTPAFCPLIRKTPKLAEMTASDLDKRAQRILEGADRMLVRRAIAYLYTKESRSSYAIEAEKPSADRIERFAQVLRNAGRIQLSKAQLVALQNQIVTDPSAIDRDWRRTQIYVGQGAGQHQVIHFIGPRASDVSSLMDGWLDSDKMWSGVDPVLQAAAMSFGFVFIHPFDDGNGRLHRFLVHHALAKRGYTPRDAIFPISAAILRQPERYDDVLEAFSRRIMPFLDYDIDADGVIEIRNETADLYRFFDATPQAEFLYDAIASTVEHDLPDELAWLARYDRAVEAVRQVADLPDKLMGILVTTCLQNEGRLSKTKRDRFLRGIPDDTIDRMVAAIQEAIQDEPTPMPPPPASGPGPGI